MWRARGQGEQALRVRQRRAWPCLLLGVCWWLWAVAACPTPGCWWFRGSRGGGGGGGSIWSGCSVRIRLWPRLPRDCHRLLSILPTCGASVECPANWCSSLDPTSAGHFSCPGSTGLGVHAGQGSLPPRAATVAGPIWPHLVGHCGGLRLKNPVGTGPVKVSAHTTHNISGGGGFHMPFTGGGAHAVCGGRCPSGGTPGASHGGAGSRPVAVRRRVRPPIDPFEYRWRRALLQVCGATTCFLFGARGFLGVKNRRDLHPIRRTGGGAGCRRGGWFQRCPLESSTCRGPRGSPRVLNPRTGQLETTALAIGRSMSLTIYPALSLGGEVPGVGLCLGPQVE